METIAALASGAVAVRDVVNLGALNAAFSNPSGAVNSAGDLQKDLDVLADEVMLEALRKAPVAFYASEELEQPVALDRSAQIAVALDPLDGSSNIDTNVSIGTIFSILPAVAGPGQDESRASCRRAGRSSRPASSSTDRSWR